MNEQQVIDLINQWIIENHNNEITANVLNPILIAMIQQPNLLIGDLGDLATEENDNLVDAINWILTQISNGNITIHTGQNNPNDTPPASYAVGDFYSQLDVMNNPLYLWQYTGTEWARISNYIDDDSISTDTTWSSQKISEAIQGDRFTQLGTLTWDENQVTASIGFEWVISGGQYFLASEWQNTIPYTSALGFSRKDIIVAVQGNSFARIQGEEGTGIVEAPPLPPNTLLVSEFDVYHDSIGEPTSPILGNAYVRKSKWFEIEEVGDDGPITTLTEAERHFIINGYTGTGDVSGFVISYPTDVYYDMVVSIWNRSGATLPLPHDDTQGGFYFPNAETYNLAENAVITFRVDNSFRLVPISVYPDDLPNRLGIFNRVVNIPFSEFGDDWANVTKENVAEKINDLEITQAQNEVHYFVVDDSILPPPVEYNFDVENVDWTDTPHGDLTLIGNFESWLASQMEMTSIDITDFTSSETRIQCNIAYDTMTDSCPFNLLGITQVNNVSFIREDVVSISFESNNLTEIPSLEPYENLTQLVLNDNNITQINNINFPNLVQLELHANSISDIENLELVQGTLGYLSLSYNNIGSLSGLEGLNSLYQVFLNNNGITTSGWNDGLTWAQNVNSGGEIDVNGNTDPITGTDFETELLSNDWNINT